MWELWWIHVGVVVERDVGVGEELRYKEGELLLWDSAWSACVQPGKSGLTMSKACVVGVGGARDFHSSTAPPTE